MAEKESKQKFMIKRVYLKDLSFEIPEDSDLFQKQWKPDINLVVAISLLPTPSPCVDFWIGYRYRSISNRPHPPNP